MSKALSIFEQPKLQLPAHIAGFLAEEKNIEDRNSVPSLGYEGKVWQISINGEKTRMVRRDDEGDEVPIQIMRVVVLDYAKERGRAYYEGAYDPAKPGTPLCWSEDGKKPNAKIEKPQATSCDKCPMSAKGSKQTDNGKSVTACSQHLMVAVVPAAKLDHEPLRLKLAITSVWDNQNKDLQAQGWFAFDNYKDWLRSKGIAHTATLVTKMKFDPTVAYPKVIFSPDRWLDDDSLKAVAPLAKSDVVKELLSATWTPAGVDGKPNETPEAFAPKPARAPIDDEDDETPPAPKATKPKAVVEIDDEEEQAAPKATKPKNTKRAEEPASKPVAAPADVSSLLDEWEDA